MLPSLIPIMRLCFLFFHSKVRGQGKGHPTAFCTVKIMNVTHTRYKHFNKPLFTHAEPRHL